VAMTDPIHQTLKDRGLLPTQHYLDSGYPSAELLTRSRTEFGVELITPLLGDHSPQAKAGADFDRASFSIDFDREQATCPQGHTSSSWNPVRQRGTDTIVISFSTTTCGPCPGREQCTISRKQRRQLTVHPHEVHTAQRQARALQDTTAWQATYALRAGVEGTIHQALTVCDTPPRPLPRPAQSPPPTRLLRGRPQPHPPARLLEQPPHGPNPHQPPRPTPARRPRSMIRN
jgi:Transposase DDE domain